MIGSEVSFSTISLIDAETRERREFEQWKRDKDIRYVGGLAVRGDVVPIKPTKPLRKVEPTPIRPRQQPSTPRQDPPLRPAAESVRDVVLSDLRERGIDPSTVRGSVSFEDESEGLGDLLRERMGVHRGELGADLRKSAQPPAPLFSPLLRQGRR